MRKFIGLAVVIAFLWVSAAPAEAVSLQQGENKVKNIDYSSYYVCGTNISAPDSEVVNPSPGDTPDLVGLELRAVFEVTGIWNNFTGAGDPYWTPGASGEELTGLFYDLEVHTVSGTWGGGLIIDLKPQLRYDTESDVLGAGGRVDLWQDTSPNYTHTGTGGGPADWRVGIAGHEDHDDFPTASDVIDTAGAADPGASLFLRGNWVPLFWTVEATPVGIVYRVNMNALIPGVPITGTGFGYWDVVVNNTGLPIADDYWGLPGSGRDIKLLTNLTIPTSVGQYDDWQARSEDPVEFFALPEPATMSLLLVGLVGGAGAYLRRRRAA